MQIDYHAQKITAHFSNLNYGRQGTMNRFTIVPQRWLLVAAICALLSRVATAAEPRVQLEQTQNGVTVRIEKITVERVLNEPAWLRRIGGADWQQKFSDEQLTALLPGKCVTLSISFSSDKKIINQAITALEFSMSDQKHSFRGTTAFDQRSWKARLDPLPVDPKAIGLEVWKVVPPQARIQDMFPARLVVETTTEDRRESRFVFDHIEF
jgi:hypothetical protein